MKQENKELLLKDLCARLPYRVIVHIKLKHNIHNLEYDSLLYGFMLSENVGISQIDGYTKFINLNEDEVKPYLRPMSSMTEEEKIESLEFAWEDDYGRLASYNENIPKYIDWLNAHYFDYRGLIEKGLALEASKDMYELKEK